MLAPVRRHQILTAGSLVVLLGGAAPAMAYTSFDVLFDSNVPGTSTGSTGVTGKMTFNFSKISPVDNKYALDLSITNTTPVIGNPSGTLVGFVFNVPGKSVTPPDFKLLSYNPLISPFNRVFGTSVRTAQPNTDLNISNLAQASLQPFGNFSFCARSTANGGGTCAGGNPQGGLLDGESAAVRFTLASNVASIDTTAEVAQSFYNLFNSWDPATNPKGPQVALRYQQVTSSSGVRGLSDKVGGRPKPPPAPPDGVPGPVPALGAAAAFGFSRRLRRRIALARGRQSASA